MGVEETPRNIRSGKRLDALGAAEATAVRYRVLVAFLCLPGAIKR